jgi:hypothetical protein
MDALLLKFYDAVMRLYLRPADPPLKQRQLAASGGAAKR